ncbi:glutamate decarboxylase [Klebsiella pneumoniae]|nr:glutamate decarboxylase [Klebsiella pneumoniae]OVV67783.1 glutamate decarboxylase [Klebsiella pneumoniae]OVV74302.1 glutamate decarboxylase [Klebsiella pneumoniae]OVV86093.1 glutamate decarboxylase [Klebsiella pneumoniae]
MAFRVLTMAVDLCRLTTRTMNVNAGHERTSKARIIHQIQLIRGITTVTTITTGCAALITKCYVFHIKIRITTLNVTAIIRLFYDQFLMESISVPPQ